jgi:CheY-like chemotaxis protein
LSHVPIHTSEAVPTDQSAVPTVLLVDDEPAIHELIGGRFRRLGYRVVCVKNGADALDWLSHDTADLVVSDLHMPFLNGFDLCRALAADEDRAMLPVLLMTADSRPLNTDGLSNLRGVVQKPFSAAQVVTRCVELIARSTAARDL